MGNRFRGKKYREGIKKVDGGKRYSVPEAMDLLSKFPKAKFDETIEVNGQRVKRFTYVGE